jgi:hypothetical protein
MAGVELPQEIVLPIPTTPKEIELYRALSDAYRNLAQAIAALDNIAALNVQEIDGTPSVSNVVTLKVTNGRLTDNGSGVVTLDLA